MENERLYINEHEYFVGMYSLNRLANSVTFNKWSGEAFGKRNSELNSLYRDFNASGAVAIWEDYDHVVPDWDSLMKLGFKGIIDRALSYKNKRIEDGTLTDEQRAYFDGIEIEYSAIIDVVDRMYRLAFTKKHKKVEKIAV